jgi:Na+-translocating ferredoxin:NAD+ oxidoreductase RnfE subunit
MIDGRSFTPWFCLCPLLAIARGWREAFVLSAALLACVVVTAGLLASMRGKVWSVLRLPLAALVAGTVAVLEDLALAAWWQALDAAVAPWLTLVAGLAVLVCCSDDGFYKNRTLTPAPLPKEEGFVRGMKLGLTLSATLLAVGLARDGSGRVFLLAETPVGVLVLLALLLAGINFAMHDPEDTSRMRAFSPPGPGLRRDDEQKRSAADRRRGDEQP